MKALIAITPVLITLSFSLSDSILGEYYGESTNGYLTIKPDTRANTFQVWLGVGSGSCGGETLINNKKGLLEGSIMIIERKVRRGTCKTVLHFNNGSVDVSDSCITSESENNSTCSLTGNYTRR